MADHAPELPSADKATEFDASLERRKKIGSICGLAAGALAFIIVPTLVIWNASFGWLLLVWFAIWLAIFHWQYAHAEKITVRHVKLMDYWYLGITAIGIVLVAWGPEKDKDRDRVWALAKAAIAAHIDDAYFDHLKSEIDSYEKRACTDTYAARFANHCAKARLLAQKGRRLSASELLMTKSELDDLAADLKEPRDAEQSSIYDAIQSVSNSMALLISVRDVHDKLIASAKSKDRPPTGLWLEILQVLGWTLVLPIALALRLTKVTIEAFEWTRARVEDTGTAVSRIKTPTENGLV